MMDKSLRDVAIRLGLIVEKTDITIPMVEKAILAFYKDKGRVPGTKDGDATGYFEFRVCWATVEGDLKRRLNTSLYKIAFRLGLVKKPPPVPAGPRLTVEEVRVAIRKFEKGHNRLPTMRDGDASEYFGRFEKWQCVQLSFIKEKRGLTSEHTLFSLGCEMFPQYKKYHPLSDDLILRAMQEFHKDHGKYPTQSSGDASQYFGFQTNWEAINACYKKGLRGLRGGETLAKFKKRMGLK